MTLPTELDPRMAAERLTEFEVIDVRGVHEFEGPLGRIRGARLIPLPALGQRASEIPRGRPLLLICRSGVRSAKACAQLGELGLGPAVNLIGGMIAWNRADLPVERTRPASVPALLDSAVAWFAQVTAQAPDAARAKLCAELGIGSLADLTRENAARALDAIARLAGSQPDSDLSIGVFRAALAEL
jgi:rhodanese-related sulfurtransferase